MKMKKEFWGRWRLQIYWNGKTDLKSLKFSRNASSIFGTAGMGLMEFKNKEGKKIQTEPLECTAEERNDC